MTVRNQQQYYKKTIFTNLDMQFVMNNTLSKCNPIKFYFCDNVLYKSYYTPECCVCKVYSARCLKQLGCDWSVGPLLRSHWSRVTAAAVQGQRQHQHTQQIINTHSVISAHTNGVTDSIVTVSATTHTLIIIDQKMISRCNLLTFRSSHKRTRHQNCILHQGTHLVSPQNMVLEVSMTLRSKKMYYH